MDKETKPTERRKEGGWERSIKRLEEEGKEEGFGTKKEGRKGGGKLEGMTLTEHRLTVK